MKILEAVIYFLCLYFTVASNVVNLTDSTIKQFLVDHPYTVIDFYATWCDHCKEFEPVYENISDMAKERKLPFVFAKMDANVNSRSKEKYDISAFPTLKVIVNGTAVTYKKELQPEPLLEYIMWKYNLRVIQLKNKQEILRIKAAKDLRVSFHIMLKPQKLIFV